VLTADEFPVAAAAERRMDRRRFLGVAGCAAALAVAGEWIGRPFATPAALDLGTIDAAALPAGSARAVASAGGEALVVHLAGGELVAFDRRCPHLGCPVLWAADRQRFECPCHRAAFDARTGRVLVGPPRRGLTPATVRFT
jgi:Rieske Fe-S protein